MARLRVALGLALAVALAACDGASWLRSRGVHTFEELEAAEAAARLAGGEGVLVQVRDSEDPSGAQPGAALLDLAAPLPPSLLATRGPVVVMAATPTAARRLAARLARSGVPRVAVVRGGIQAWLAGGSGETAPPWPGQAPRT